MPAYGMLRIGQRRVDASKLTGHRRHSQHSSRTTPPTLVSHTIERGFVARVLVIAVSLTRSWMRRGSRN